MDSAAVKSGFVYLASQSPRRAELLQQLGLRFEIIKATVDESLQPDEAPEAYVRRVARDKAEAAVAALSGAIRAPIVTADTSVVLAGEILGKPRDREDGLAMLAKLSGQTHQVLSAVTVRTAAGGREALSVSQVRFREISAQEAEAYWRTGEPLGKAGGYAIQGHAAIFVEHLEGSYSGVMGLPLFETAALLREVGVRLLPEEDAQQQFGEV